MKTELCVNISIKGAKKLSLHLSMAEAVVSITLESLSDLIAKEVKFLSGVRNQVEGICREFKRMQCFLQDVDARKSRDQFVHNCVQEIRSLSYRAENVIETYAAEVTSRKGRGIIKALKRFACIMNKATTVHNVGVEIEDIKSQITELTTSLQAYGIRAINDGENTGSLNEKQRWLRKTYGHEVDYYFVGMEADIYQLVSLLKDGDMHSRFISIWSMGGAGKTTVARKIYKDANVRQYFHAFAWVCITQECKIRSVFEEISKQLFPLAKRNQVMSMADDELVRELYNFQKEKRCLVVLDDIWKLDDWKCLKPAFPIKEGTGKVLLTTRNREVAEVGLLHKLNYLNECEAWELLQKKAFSQKDVEDIKIDSEFEHLGKEMVRKCGNLPLAVSVLGGILSERSSISEWKMVNKNIDMYLKRSESNKEKQGITQVLALSYDQLPYHLKPCFLYLSAFREDEDINIEMLYLLWMAEGIIMLKDRLGDESMMDVAERYLDQLAYMSMVQVQTNESSTARKFRSCRLHDLMRDLCLEKAKEEEFLEVKEFQGGKQQHSLDSPSSDSTANRLAINIFNFSLVESSFSDHNQDANRIVEERLQQLRALLFVCSGSISYCPLGNSFLEKLSNYFGKFKMLRVLVFKMLRFPNTGLPKEIGQLIHLRFLSFNGSRNLKDLPSAVGYLLYLQTLDLRVENSVKIPNVLLKLKVLRHLYLPGMYSVRKRKAKLRLHGLSKLETLVDIDADEVEVSDLSKLTNLRVFKARAYDDSSIALISQNFAEMKFPYLQEMDLAIYFDFVSSKKTSPNLLRQVFFCGKLRLLKIEGHIDRLPKYELGFLTDLIELKLFSNEIEEDPMQTLEKLPNLQRLLLGTHAFVGKELSCHAEGFPKLTFLELRCLKNLEKWRIDGRAMPSLSQVEICRCMKLEMIPDGLRFITTIKQLKIEFMPKEFKKRIRMENGREGVDFDKIRHIPVICLY